MEIKVVGIQPGTVTPGMSNEEYVDKQIAYMESVVEKENPYLVAFPEMMTGIYFGMVREKKWFQYAEDFFTGPTTAKMLKESKKLNIHIAYSLFEKAVENGKEVYYFNRISILNKKEMTETEIALDFPDVELDKTIVTYEIDDSELVFIQTNTNPEKSYMVYEF